MTAISACTAEPHPARTDLSPAGLLAAIVDDFRASATRRRGLAGERVIDTPAVLAHVTSVHSADVNQVVRARLGGGRADVEGAIDVDAAIEVDAAIAATIREFGGRPFLWWVGPGDEPADLTDRLVAHGVGFLDEIPGMALDLADLADETASPPPAELTITPALDAAAIDDFNAVLSHGFPEDFGDDDATAAIAAGTAKVAAESGYREPSGLPTRWIGSVAGRPVATARLHTAAGVAGVYTVVTVTDARRRGYGAAMTRRALLAARDTGLRVATLQASDAGRGIYGRMGFRTICTFRIHEWQP